MRAACGTFAGRKLTFANDGNWVESCHSSYLFIPVQRLHLNTTPQTGIPCPFDDANQGWIIVAHQRNTGRVYLIWTDSRDHLE